MLCVKGLNLIWRSRILFLAIVTILIVILIQFADHVPFPRSITILQPLPPVPSGRILPHEYWQHRREHPSRYTQHSSYKFPRPEHIQKAAASWQRHNVTGGSLYLYAAHWDPRPEEPVVRLLVYCDVTPLPNLTCLLWYENRNAPDYIPALATYGWRPTWGGPTDTVNEPYILTCPVQHKTDVPRAASLANTLYESPHNLLSVQGAPREQEKWKPPNSTSIAACIKWLNYTEDVSSDFVEWVELIREFGAQKLFVYILKLHPNMRRVLSYYEAQGFADVTELDHPPREREQGGQVWRTFWAMRRELLPLNDALYRSMSHFAWLAVFDMDEVIVPLKHNSWQGLIEHEMQGYQVTDVDALVFRNYYFLAGAQRERAASPPAHMLADVWRAREPSKPGFHVKSFHNTRGVISMHNHMPISCFHGTLACRVREIPIEVGRLQHYRSECDNNKFDCPELHDTVRDDGLYKHSILQRTKHILKKLRIPFPEPRHLPNLDPITQPYTTTLVTNR